MKQSVYLLTLYIMKSMIIEKKQPAVISHPSAAQMQWVQITGSGIC